MDTTQGGLREALLSAAPEAGVQHSAIALGETLGFVAGELDVAQMRFGVAHLSAHIGNL